MLRCKHDGTDRCAHQEDSHAEILHPVPQYRVNRFLFKLSKRANGIRLPIGLFQKSKKLRSHPLKRLELLIDDSEPFSRDRLDDPARFGSSRLRIGSEHVYRCKLLDLFEGESDVLTPAHEEHAFQVLFAVHAITRRCARGLPEDPFAFVKSQRLDVNAGLLRQVADLHHGYFEPYTTVQSQSHPVAPEDCGKRRTIFRDEAVGYASADA